MMRQFAGGKVALAVSGAHRYTGIHVEYQGFEALVAIATGEVTQGQLPRKVASIVKEWCLLHQTELVDNWQKAQRFEPLDRIQGADRD